jgi:hypothetical protein
MHPITSNLHTCAKKILALGYFINIVPAVKPRIEFQLLHTHPHTPTHTLLGSSRLELTSSNPNHSNDSHIFGALSVLKRIGFACMLVL